MYCSSSCQNEAGTRASRGAVSSMRHTVEVSSWLASCRAVMSALNSCAEVGRYLRTGQQTRAGWTDLHQCVSLTPEGVS